MRKRTGLDAIAFLILALAAGACNRESAQLRQAPPYAMNTAPVRQSDLVPGPAWEPRAAFEVRMDDRTLGEGRRLYGWYNCSGCHFAGGGGIGPPLMDDQWVYGSHPANIASSIIEGRPNGMPAFGGRIPAEHLGPLVSYVRSLSASGNEGAASSGAAVQSGQGDAESNSRQQKEAGGR